MNNPIFNKVKDNIKKSNTKDTSLISLCLSLVSVFVFVLASVIFKYLDSREAVIDIACISFVLLVGLTVAFGYKTFKTIVFHVIYSVLLGLSLSQISLATYNVLKSFFEAPLILFIITFTMLLITLVESILYYIKGFLVNHFFFKMIFVSLITIVINGVILIIIIKSFTIVYFMYLILSTIVSLAYSIILTLYFEEIRKIKDNIDAVYVYDLSIVPLTLTLYYFPEVFYFLFRKRKEEN